MFTQLVTEWVVEQWAHAVPMTVGEAPAVVEVVVPAAFVAAVVAEAEVLCAAAAVVEAAAVSVTA